MGLWGCGTVALQWLREKEESQYELLIFKPNRQHSSLGSKGSRTGLVVERASLLPLPVLLRAILLLGQSVL